MKTGQNICRIKNPLRGKKGENFLQAKYPAIQYLILKNITIIYRSHFTIPGQQCWILYIDALVLEWSGGMLDTLSLGVRAALLSTLIPKLTVTGEGDEMEIEISDNPHDSTRVEAANAPIIVTLTQV